MRKLAIAGAVLLVAMGGVAAVVLTGLGRGEDTEEPDYTVVATHEGFELRRYEGWIAARVTLDGSFREATYQGFRILAGYIGGANAKRASIDMTTPVAAAPSQAIDMTAPVSATAGDRGWTIAFMMPSRWSLDTLPVPEDDRIELVGIPPSTRAVATFSGWTRSTRVQERITALRAAVRDAGYRIDGEPRVAQFDPPWVLGPFRRNEIQLPVEAPDDVSSGGADRPPGG